MTYKKILIWVALSICLILTVSTFFTDYLALSVGACGVLLFLLAFQFRSASHILLTCGSILVVIAIIELTLFLTHKDLKWNPNHYGTYKGEIKTYGRIPVEGVHRARRLLGDEVIYDVKYTIGKDGLRITPRNVSVNEKNRINFFGGSFIYGEGLEDNETLPYFFKELHPDLSVKNFGMHGWGVHNAVAILETENIKGEVNVLLTGLYHALRSSCYQKWTRAHPYYQLNSNGVVEYLGSCEERIHKKRIDKNSIWNKILSHCYICKKVSLVFDTPYITIDMIERYVGLLDRMRDISHKNGQLFIIGYLRDDSKNQAINEDKIFAEIRRIADIAIDLTLGENRHALSSEYIIHKRDRHPSARANFERAKLLDAVL